MSIKITKYNCLCNLGDDIDEVFVNAINGKSCAFKNTETIIKNKRVRIGLIESDLPKIDNADYNLRCNRLVLKCLEKLDIEGIIQKHGSENIAVVAATTNSGVEEYSQTQNPKFYEIGNPAEFLYKHFNLKNCYTSVSTACSSGIKAFSIGQELLNSGFAKSVIIVAVDSIAKVPVFGFDSLEILSQDISVPFDKDRKGINIGEGAAAFILEKDVENGIEIAGIGETTDFFHTTTPDPKAEEAINAINLALKNSGLKPEDIDYINLHGTGTGANDLMEGVAVNRIFKNKVLASSTKPLTGHCLGAAAGIEVCLCAKLLDANINKVFPHIFSGNYDENIPLINLALSGQNSVDRLNTCLCTSFGFSGTNTAIILRRSK